MKFKFWGVRGSIPTPGPHTVKYGGNTTCIQVTNSSNDLLILDAGTGIFSLAQSLNSQAPITAHLLMTHTHWDHIQGLPFFLPIFYANNEINIYGGRDFDTRQGIERALTMQLQHSFFPITEQQLQANINYHTLHPLKSIQIGNSKITPVLLNHPVINLGYRIDDTDGSSLFFTGDYEPPFNPYPESHWQYAKQQASIESQLQTTLNAISQVDALIVDSSYTEQEYPSKTGWGHGTFGQAIDMANMTGCKQLFFTHHDPARRDSELEVIYQQVIQDNHGAGFEMFLAREGDEYVLGG